MDRQTTEKQRARRRETSEWREKERTGAGDVRVVARGVQVQGDCDSEIALSLSGILEYTDFFKTTSYYKLNIFQEIFFSTGLSPHTRTLLHT
jgi:hypothetical protein